MALQLAEGQFGNHSAYSHYYLTRLRRWNDRALHSVSSTENTDSIIRLLLDNTDMTDQDCFLLADALADNASLRTLSISQNPKITVAGVIAIVKAATRHSSLQALRVGLNPFASHQFSPFSDGPSALSQPPPEELLFDKIIEGDANHRRLIIGDCAQSLTSWTPQVDSNYEIEGTAVDQVDWPALEEVYACLAQAAASSTTLTVIEAPSLPAQISTEGDISEALEFRNPHAIAIDTARKQLKATQRFAALTQLAARLNAFHAPEWKRVILAACGQTASLTIVDLSYPKVEPPRQFHAALKTFTGTLRPNLTVTRLFLCGFSKIGFGDEGAITIATILRTNKTLCELSLRDNAIGTAGALAIADALEGVDPNDTHRQIKRSASGWLNRKEEESGFQPNKSLTELDLSDNNLTDAAAQRFLKLVECAPCALGYLPIDGNCIKPNLVSLLHQQLMLNTQPPKFKTMIPYLSSNDASITRVVFNSGNAKLSDLSCRVLLQAMRANSHVTVLDLSNNNITSDGAAHIADIIASCQTLKKVIAQFNAIDDRGGLLILGAVPRNPTVELVDLKFQQGPGISEDILHKLSWLASLNGHPFELKSKGLLLVQNDPSLTSLHLSPSDGRRHLTNEGVNLLLEMLSANTAVTDLSIANNPTKGSVDIPKVIPCLTGAFCARLTRLDLSNNGLTDDVADYFTETLGNPKFNACLHSLILSKNFFSGLGAAQPWAQILRERNDTLTHFDVSDNPEITADDAAALEYCCALNAHDRAFKGLVQRALGNDPTLREIKLSQIAKTTPWGTSHRFIKRYDDTSARLIAGALEQNTHVTRLDIAGNSVGDEGAKSLSKLLQINASLTAVDLAGNEIGDAGLSALARALMENHQVRILVYTGNKAKDPVIQKTLNANLAHNNAIGRTDGDIAEDGSQPNTAAVYNAAMARKRQQLRIAAKEDLQLEQAIMADAMADFHKSRQRAAVKARQEAEAARKARQESAEEAERSRHQLQPESSSSNQDQKTTDQQIPVASASSSPNDESGTVVANPADQSAPEAAP